MDLTTVVRVKALAFDDKSGDTSKDALLGTLITNVSARVASALGRHVQTGSRQEEYEVERGSKIVQLRGAPVSTVTAITYSGTPADDDATALTVNDDYRLDANPGIVRLLLSPTNYDPGFLRLTYDGGMADDTATFITAYPDIAGAVDAQVVYEYKRKANPAGNVKIQGHETTYMGEVNLLQSVRDVIQMYSLEAF